MTRDEAKEYLKEIASDLGFTGIEEYTCKHGVKMLEAIEVLEQEPILDKISTEIDQKQYDFMSDKEYDEGVRFGLMLAYQIIDKYKAESEGI